MTKINKTFKKKEIYHYYRWREAFKNCFIQSKFI